MPYRFVWTTQMRLISTSLCRWCPENPYCVTWFWALISDISICSVRDRSTWGRGQGSISEAGRMAAWLLLYFRLIDNCGVFFFKKVIRSNLNWECGVGSWLSPDLFLTPSLQGLCAYVCLQNLQILGAYKFFLTGQIAAWGGESWPQGKRSWILIWICNHVVGNSSVVIAYSHNFWGQAFHMRRHTFIHMGFEPWHLSLGFKSACF